MNPISFVTRPVKDLIDALVMPFRALFVIGITYVINAMTYSGSWWFKWVALGMGIAVLASFGRALKSLLIVGLVAWVGWKIYQRYGEAAKQRFDDWVNRGRPGPAEIVGALRAPF